MVTRREKVNLDGRSEGPEDTFCLVVSLSITLLTLSVTFTYQPLSSSSSSSFFFSLHDDSITKIKLEPGSLHLLIINTIKHGAQAGVLRDLVAPVAHPSLSHVPCIHPRLGLHIFHRAVLHHLVNGYRVIPHLDEGSDLTNTSLIMFYCYYYVDYCYCYCCCCFERERK
jgi:hypothetical protein